MTTVTIQQNVGGYTGTYDTYLRESRPTTQYGTATTVISDGVDSSGLKIQGLLEFSNIFGDGPGQIPLGSTITSATLTLTLSDGTTSPVQFYRMAENWAAVPSWTWDSFGGGIQTDGVEALAAADVSLAGLGTGAQTINVLQSLQAWSGGAANYGWLLSIAGSDGFIFSSSEGTAAPVLTVTYEPPVTTVPGLNVVESGGTTAVTEGGAGDTLLISLKTAPISDVTITIWTAGSDDIGMVPTVLTFTTANWMTQQSVALSAINDTLIEPTETYTVTVTATSADGSYDGLSSNVTVTVNDNDSLPTVLTPAVVAIHNTSLYTAGDSSKVPGCGDPSGIAYIPGLNRLFIVDSEHDEAPYNSQKNLFITTLDGTFIESVSLRSFTREPTGIAYNPFNGNLYISDDSARKIFIVSALNPKVLLSTIDLAPYGFTDAEDPTIDPVTGHIYMLDGVSRKFIELTETGALVQSTVLPTAIKDAEGLAYDAVRDVFYIASGANRGTIFQTDHDGHILASFDINSYLNPVTGSQPKIKGLVLAPSSDPTDGDRLSLYAVDYGKDQGLDGRMFEIDLYHGWLGV
jgi:SdiA-regulated